MSTKTILIVDDDPDIVELTKNRLSSVGYNTVTASNPLDAMRFIKTSPPDLLLLDIKMPEISGSKLCWILKEGHKYANIPVIIVSGQNIANLSQLLQQINANAFIRKPFDGNHLIAKVDELLQVREPATA